MEIHLLGPLVVRYDATSVLPTASKPRQVFSLLLLNESQIVPNPVLMKELWSDLCPKTATTTLQTYVLQLRKQLGRVLCTSVGEVSKTILQTRNGGYLLNLPADAQIDLVEYRRLEQTGLAAFQRDDNETAVRLFDQALALWNGAALADVSHGHFLRAAVAGLEQSRLTMIEYRLEAGLRTGHHRELLSELASLVLEHNYNENLHAQYMIALHRSGYRTKALDVYNRLRTSMVGELGLEPSPKLRELQHALLTAEAAPDRSARSPSAELKNPFHFEIDYSH